MDSQDIAYISHLKVGQFDRVLPDLVSIERSAGDDRWYETNFKAHLKEGRANRNTILAEVGDRVVGYLVYDVRDTQFEIIKMRVDAGFGDQAIEKQLLDTMVKKLETTQKMGIRFIVPEYQDALLPLLRDRYSFRIDKDEPMLKQRFRNRYSGYNMFRDSMEKAQAGAALVEFPRDPRISVDIAPPAAPDSMHCQYIISPAHPKPILVRGAKADAQPEKPSPPDAAPLPARELMEKSLAKLQEWTGVAWEIVKSGEAGALEKVAGLPSGLRSTAGYSYRTLDAVPRPDEARQDLRAFLNAPEAKTFAARLGKPAPVDIPADWMRRIHLHSGSPGVLAASFGGGRGPGETMSGAVR